MDLLALRRVASLGLGGWQHPVSSDVDRARTRVDREIRSAIEKIRAGAPLLGHHLSTTVETGDFCGYSPDPDHRTTWQR